MTVATANFPEQQYVGSVLLYLLVAAIVGMPYVAWLGRKAAPALESGAA